ncbi:MAG: hypothetical protein JWL60_2435 [Gemmatimonadetes bacterium]|jgi:hypothetical protein|nr:hypothetical protein [Gemmatimonadota bacterium]
MGGVNGVRGRRLLGVAAAGLCVASACGRDEVGTGPYAREVAEAIPRIEKATGMTFKTPPRVEGRSKAQVRDFLLAKFDEATPAQQLAGEEAAYKLLGMLPDSLDLRKFFLAVLTEQVVGYYDPAKKVLYVVEGADESTLGITLTHELIHALQDQYINLDSLQKSTKDNDRLSASQAVIEGQAQFEQLSLMVGGPQNIALRVGGRDRIRELIRENQSAMPVFATAPMVIQESLLFPYLSGADFVQRFKEQRGTASPLQNIPRSTEQILHTPAYFGAAPDEPSTVTLPAPRGARNVYENDLGEFGTRLFLYQHRSDETSSARAAAGWDGDRFMVLEGAGGRGLVWVSVWDSALEAAEFSDAANRATIRRTGAGERSLPDGGKSFSAKGRTTTIRPHSIGDRTLLVYTDLPDAMAPSVIDVTQIRITAR